MGLRSAVNAEVHWGELRKQLWVKASSDIVKVESHTPVTFKTRKSIQTASIRKSVQDEEVPVGVLV